MARVVVIGGGYAGLACLIELAKKAPQLELHLVDARAEHCKTTELQRWQQQNRLPLGAGQFQDDLFLDGVGFHKRNGARG